MGLLIHLLTCLDIVWYVKFHGDGSLASLTVVVSYVYLIINKDTGQLAVYRMGMNKEKI